jgi:hypothetical protein
MPTTHLMILHWSSNMRLINERYCHRLRVEFKTYTKRWQLNLLDTLLTVLHYSSLCGTIVNSYNLQFSSLHTLGPHGLLSHTSPWVLASSGSPSRVHKLSHTIAPSTLDSVHSLEQLFLSLLLHRLLLLFCMEFS